MARTSRTKYGISLPEDQDLALRVQESGSFTYIGEADAGTVETDAKWRIKRIETSGSDTDFTLVTFASGSDRFDNIWSDRLTLPYI